jgi:hypothetical protein
MKAGVLPWQYWQAGERGSNDSDAVRNTTRATSSNTPVLPWLAQRQFNRTSLRGLPFELSDWQLILALFLIAEAHFSWLWRFSTTSTKWMLSV